MTKLFTFQIDLTLQVLAENDEQARQHLDQSGGYVRSRKVSMTSVEETQDLVDPSLASVTNLIAAKGGHNKKKDQKPTSLSAQCPSCPVLIIAKNADALSKGLEDHKTSAHPVVEEIPLVPRSVSPEE